jgi:hypothetical protein
MNQIIILTIYLVHNELAVWQAVVFYIQKFSNNDMAEKPFFQQLGIGVSSLTFGVALSVFIYAAATRIPSSMTAWLLFVASFLLMLRFWWRYNELFVQFLPSRTFWHFLFDFAIAFFGILAVLLVNNMQLWALVGASAMIASTIRCGLSWHDAKDKVKKSLKRTIVGSVFMLIIMLIIYLLAFFVDHIVLSSAILVIVLIFVIYTSKRP